MKELNTVTKTKVMKLFLTGYTYDDIAKQVGIGKGSVSNIIEQFREGELPVPPAMAEYVDALRHLVVDLKKHDTSVPQLKSYVKLHVRLNEMGVGVDEVDQWLDICQDIATASVSSSQFVKAALELAHLESENGVSCADVLADYNAKLQESSKLQKEIQDRKEALKTAKEEHKEQKAQAKEELDTITKAIATTQATFKQQKKELKADLEEHLVQHQLSWNKVSTAWAVMTSALGDAGLKPDGIEEVAKEIADTGSLAVLKRQLGHEKQVLEAEVEQLSKQRHELDNKVRELTHGSAGTERVLFQSKQMNAGLATTIKERESQLKELQSVVSRFAEDVHNVRLILGFLLMPNRLGDRDLDELVELMLHARQLRLGIDHKKVTDSDGNLVCECRVPELGINADAYEVNIDNARRRLAISLMPLVTSDYVPKWEWRSEQYKELLHSLIDLEDKTREFR